MSPYRKRAGSYNRRGRIPHRVDISERPSIVDARERGGAGKAIQLSAQAKVHWSR